MYRCILQHLKIVSVTKRSFIAKARLPEGWINNPHPLITLTLSNTLDVTL